MRFGDSATVASAPPIRGEFAPRAPLIEVAEVGHRYGSGASTCIALSAISLTIDANNFVAVTGPSGSGKSTLLSIVGGLERPSCGRVRIEGRDLAMLRDADAADFRLDHIGFVFQEARLIPVISVAENVELPLLFRRDLDRAERKRRVAAMLTEVGLWSKRDRLPHELSGGERQRAALARALAGEPAIVLADEPTANLDQHAGAAVIGLLQSLRTRRGAAVICATHDAQLIRSADAVVRLCDGRMETSVP